MKRVAIATALVVALAAAAWCAVLVLRADDDMRIVRDFFVDEQTLAFERHATGEFPPLAGRGGHAVVIAKCFQGDDGLVIGWLVRYPDELKHRLDEARASGMLGPDLLISASLAAEVRGTSPDAPWIARSSPEGQALCVSPKLADGSDAIPAQPSE